jgi:hypothetical protein
MLSQLKCSAGLRAMCHMRTKLGSEKGITKEIIDPRGERA